MYESKTIKQLSGAVNGALNSFFILRYLIKRLYPRNGISGSNRTHVYGWRLLKALKLSMKEYKPDKFSRLIKSESLSGFFYLQKIFIKPLTQRLAAHISGGLSICK